MKLRNKKTGEIKDWSFAMLQNIAQTTEWEHYASLAELNEEWEDYEEKGWYITENGEVRENRSLGIVEEESEYREIGNYFETEKEAEKAVEKFKAWKRLKDKGFKFSSWTIDDGSRISICTNTDEDDIYDEDKRKIKPDLDLLFGGEE